MAKNISRKEFLKATAMSAAGIGLLGAGATVDCQAITGGIMTAFSHKTS